MFSSHSLFLLALVAAFTLAVTPTANAFVVPALTKQSFSVQPLNIFNKKQEEDLSYIESRDMTREEMLELNKKNEDIMNMELTAMSLFSAVLCLPIFYLCWVAFFSD